jgi:hypothetical protein
MKTNFIQKANYNYYYFFIKHRKTRSRYELAEKLGLQPNIVLAIREEVNAKKLEKLDAYRTDMINFEQQRKNNPVFYWNDEDEIMKADMHHVHELSFNDLSAEEKEIWNQLQNNELQVDSIVIFDKVSAA